MSSSELERLNSDIERMLDDNISDENKLSVMKRHKLWLKDKIQELESKEQKQNL